MNTSPWRTVAVAVASAAAIALVGGALAALWIARADPRPDRHPTPDLLVPTRGWTRYSDFVTVDDGGAVVTAAPQVDANRAGKLTAALSVAHDLVPHDVVDLAEAALRAEVAEEVDAAAHGDRPAAAALARVLVLQRLGGVSAVSEQQVLDLADALVLAGSPTRWDESVSGTYWLRSELGRMLAERGDTARAHQVARLDPAFVCAVAGAAGSDPSLVALVVSYQRTAAPAPCIDAAVTTARNAVLAHVDGASVHLLDQLGGLDAASRPAVGRWLDQQVADGSQRSADALVDMAIAARLLGGAAAQPLGPAAARTLRTLALLPDSVSGQPSFDAALFVELDEASGSRPWTERISLDAQLEASGGDWARLVAAGSGVGSADSVRRPCGVRDQRAVTGGLPPFSLVVALALDYAATDCDAVGADAAAASVAESPRLSDGLGERVRAWASAYVGCRYVRGADDEAALRDRIAAQPWSAPATWAIDANPADYYPMFDDYALAWLHQFVAERRSCRELAIWPAWRDR